MATEFRCDCCKTVYKVKDDELACVKCAPVLQEWKRHQDTLLATYLEDLDKERDKFFASKGIELPTPADSPQSTSASATSHAGASRRGRKPGSIPVKSANGAG
jgi:hypothetical protein